MGVRFDGVQQRLWSKYDLIIAQTKLTITDRCPSAQKQEQLKKSWKCQMSTPTY